MTILASELKAYKSAVVSNAAGNGGVLSAVEVVSGVKNNVFPDVSQAERAAGVTHYRKVFHKVANDADETLVSAKVHLLNYTAADDIVTIFEGTQIDTQGDIVAPVEYGAGKLKTGVVAGGTSLVVSVEDIALVLFRTGDSVFISDGVNEEYHDNVTIVKVGIDVTITLDAGDQLLHDYATVNTYAASILAFGDIESTVDGWLESSGGGTYDEVTYPVLPDNIGSVEDTFTVTFTDNAGNFSVSGARLGALGVGDITHDFMPINAAFVKPYFTLRLAGWAGVWQLGDTVIFATHPAAVPVWRKRVVPAGAASFAANQYTVRFIGETA